MAPEFIRLITLEKIRSFSPGRDIISVAIKALLVAFILFYLLGIAFFVALALENFFEIDDIPLFLSSAAVYYVLAEFLLRFFLQKRPLFDLNRYLHLPIKRSGIIHFLLGKSLLTTFSLMAIILFTPVIVSEVIPAYGVAPAALWLGTIVAISLSLHWLVLWLKETIAQTFAGMITVVFIVSLPFILLYFNILNLGPHTAPFFSAAFTGPLPLLISLGFCVLSYRLILWYYSKNAYLDQTGKAKPLMYSGSDSKLFSRFGAPGVLADLELKLILRHKKSRGFLMLSLLILFYGLLFYDVTPAGETARIGHIHLFLGMFITGMFCMQYAQLFLSWNASFFDFYMVKNEGLKDLIKGKILLLSSTTIIAFILSLPYLYFGWHVLLIHSAGLLFNLGIGIHMVVLLSLWEPKPMSLNKGVLFNYEGVGIAQYLMIIPLMIIPYGIYIPITILFDAFTALFAVCVAGLIGLLFHKPLVNLSVKIVGRNRHKISSSFRRGT